MEEKTNREDIKKYIDKYYVPGNDDIDPCSHEVKSFFERITEYRKKRRKNIDLGNKIHRKEPVAPHDDRVSSMPGDQAVKTIRYERPVDNMVVGSRNLDDLMSQMDETFSQKLLRMIHERDMQESEAYKRAFVDRRHFSKIKKDEYYTPNKKTVLAFSVALELTLDETKDLLRSAGYALSRSSKFDIIIVYSVMFSAVMV